jgi:hypothetical protein
VIPILWSVCPPELASGVAAAIRKNIDVQHVIGSKPWIVILNGVKDLATEQEVSLIRGLDASLRSA